MKLLLSFFLSTFIGLTTTASIADETCRGDTSLSIDTQIAQVELAIKERDRRYGLMFRSSMGENCGMLFVFGDSRPRIFTMRNTLIPLDIAFIDDEGRIAEILTMEPGGDRYPSSVSARYALEMNKGWFSANNISVDTLIAISGKSGEKVSLKSIIGGK